MFFLEQLTKIEDVRSGDVIRVISEESCCAIDAGVITMFVVDSKENGLIAIPQDFHSWIIRCASMGVNWEIPVEKLFDLGVDIYYVEGFDELLGSIILVESLVEKERKKK